MKRILFLIFFEAISIKGFTFYQSIDLFPSVKEWTKSKTIFWGPSNLYTPIDGAADMFLSYNFEEMQSTVYSRDSDYIRVEVYRHKTTVDAYGAYSQEKPQKDIYIDLGIEGYTEPSYINFVTGRYYIKITSWQPSEETSSAMVTIATMQASLLNEKSQFPFIFHAFPENEKIRHSEKYYNENVLGYSFLHSSFEVNYQSENGNYTLFILKGSSKEDAAAMLKSYADYFNATPGEAGLYIIDDEYTGKVYIQPIEDMLICSRGNIDADKSSLLFTLIERNLKNLKI
jgi:hypothetical protein